MGFAPHPVRWGAFRYLLNITDYVAVYSAYNRSVIGIGCIDCVKVC